MIAPVGNTREWRVTAISVQQLQSGRGADRPDPRHHAALLLAVVLAGVVGTETELLLIGHYEDLTQRIPLGLLFLTFTVLCWHLTKPGPASVRGVQATMVLCIVAGAIGMLFHYHGAEEFQLEVNPSIRGVALFWKVMRAKAPPALAPAALIGLGVLGLTYAFDIRLCAATQMDREKRFEEER